MYKFGDSINTSFDKSDTISETSESINNNIVLTDVLLLVNKNRVSLFNSLMNNYLESFKNLNFKFDNSVIETVSNMMGTEENKSEDHDDEVTVEDEVTVDE